MIRRALIIAHDHVTPSGHVGDRLAEHGYELVPHQVVPAERFGDPGVDADFPDFAAFDLIVPMGAPWSVYGDDVASWVRPELDQLRRADAAGVPVLGICFGGQLLAAAHGGSVQAAPRPEIGWVDVASEDEDLVPSGPWFEWHYDRWVSPPGSREIARNSAAVQAFVLRRNLAVQFHPELFPEMLAGWLNNGGTQKAVEAGLDPGLLLAETRQREAESRTRAAHLVDAFLTRIAHPAFS